MNNEDYKNQVIQPYKKICRLKPIASTAKKF